MKKNVNYIGRIILLCFIGLLLLPLEGHAQGEASQEEESPAGFTVESIIPENQVDTTKTYYYLKMEPQQHQTIQVKVTSLKKEPVTVKVAVHDAVSSNVGAIDYANANPKLDNSLKTPLTSFVKVKDDIKEVTVENFEEKLVDFEIQTPAASFPGVKLGSLRFVKKNEEKKKSGVTPEFAYVIALMLTEDGEQFNHGAELHLKKVGLQLSNGKKVIAANIQNDQPKVLQKLKIEGSLTKKGESKPTYQHKVKDFSVAPNSNFNFELPLGLEHVKTGTYIFKGKAEGDGRVWEWEKEVNLGKEQVDKVNQNAAYQILVPGWIPWTAMSLILLLLILIAYLFIRERKWKEEIK